MTILVLSVNIAIIGVSMERLSNQDMTLEEYVTSLITDYNETLTDFNLVESDTNNSILAGKPAYKLVCILM